MACDLNDLHAAQALVATEAEKIGGFDILINYAALIINRPCQEFSLLEYEDQIRVNSSAAFALTLVCARAMKQRHWGKMVNFTSVTLRGMLDVTCPMSPPKRRCWG